MSTEDNTAERSRRKIREGVVASDKMDRTITVLVSQQKPHPLYGKTITRSTKLAVHDEDNDAREGDLVRVMETKPLSKTKRWRLLEILERAR